MRSTIEIVVSDHPRLSISRISGHSRRNIALLPRFFLNDNFLSRASTSKFSSVFSIIRPFLQLSDLIQISQKILHNEWQEPKQKLRQLQKKRQEHCKTANNYSKQCKGGCFFCVSFAYTAPPHFLLHHLAKTSVMSFLCAAFSIVASHCQAC